MFSTIPHLTDPARVDEVNRYDHTDPWLISRLDEVAAQTASLSGMQISLVTLVTDLTQRSVGLHGLPDTVTLAGHTIGRFDLPAEAAICAPMISSGHSQVIPDLREDPRYAQHPLVTELGVRSYVGVPLIGRTGHTLGGHCVLSYQPRTTQVTDILALELGAARAVSLLNMRRTQRDGARHASAGA